MSKRQKTDADAANFKIGIEAEAFVGICAYRNPDLPGFSAVLKQRFSDFLVNEIALDGEIVRLTSTDDITVPEVHVEKGPVLTEEECRLAICEIVGDAAMVDIEKLVQGQIDGPVTTKDIVEKITRTTLHNLCKVFKDGALATVTSGKAILIESKKDSRGQDRKYHRSRDGKRANVPSHLQFVLFKENRDTMDAVSHIASMLRIRPSSFTYAGTKDRRGVTSQLVVVDRTLSTRLYHLNKAHIRGVTVGNFKYVQGPLKLGDLSGNYFTITLRDVKCYDEELMNEGFRSLSECGFLNYFGMQRFGTASVSTHDVGQAILTGQYERACHLILDPRDGDHESSVDARKAWSDGNFFDAFDLFPFRCTAERALLAVLIKQPNAYQMAISQIPRNLKLMYCHAFQSYVWNTMVTARVEKYGFAPVIGDLVAINSMMTDDERADWKERAAVKILQSEEECLQYTFKDLVLPLPGHSVVYPSNEIGAMYRGLCDKHGWDAAEQKTGAEKEYSLTGDYRPICGTVRDLNWKFIRYSDPMLPLIITDLDKINQTNVLRSDCTNDIVTTTLTPTPPMSVKGTYHI